jgi:Holliday junction resolvase RusA-like endonuclease
MSNSPTEPRVSASKVASFLAEHDTVGAVATYFAVRLARDLRDARELSEERRQWIATWGGLPTEVGLQCQECGLTPPHDEHCSVPRLIDTDLVQPQSPALADARPASQPEASAMTEDDLLAAGGWTKVLAVGYDGDPKSKARPRVVVRGGRARAYTPADSAAAEAVVTALLRVALAGRKPSDRLLDYRVVCIFHMTTHQRRDLDNMVKLVLDAGTKASVWNDDCEVTHLEASVVRGAAKGHTDLWIGARANTSLPRAACRNCGVEFDRRIGRVFCSNACREAYRLRFTCENCHVSFQRPPSGADCETHFCSRACYSAFRARSVIHLVCPRCGNGFTRRGAAYRAVTGRPRYCSKACQRPDAARCPAGHLYDYTDPRGGQQCMECRRSALQRHRARALGPRVVVTA